MRESHTIGRKVAAVLCAVLLWMPLATAAAPPAEEGSHATAWWSSLDSRLLQLVADWWPETPRAEAEARRLGPTPSPDGDEGRFGGGRVKVFAKDGSTCPGEGGPGWDPNGCS